VLDVVLARWSVHQRLNRLVPLGRLALSPTLQQQMSSTETHTQ